MLRYLTGEINQDPICNLSHSDKLRLCASVFASKVYRNKITFKPLISNVEEVCVRKEVSFLADISKRRRFLITIAQRHLEYDRIYEERMFTCKVSSVATPTTHSKEFFYYVSRGSKPHTVFLYWQKFSDDRLFVDNYMKNVSIVGASSFDNNTSTSESHPEGEDDDTSSRVSDARISARHLEGETSGTNKSINYDTTNVLNFNK